MKKDKWQKTTFNKLAKKYNIKYLHELIHLLNYQSIYIENGEFVVEYKE